MLEHIESGECRGAGEPRRRCVLRSMGVVGRALGGSGAPPALRGAHVGAGLGAFALEAEPLLFRCCIIWAMYWAIIWNMGAFALLAM